ncbi:MAG: choice-of-anchor tandem repeat NxxGxxAF-containing protein [Phycisphaerales bacterium]|jgi:hypothetical protein|nr:hypothetical protein [Phycisphaeraceae bacterium]
MNPSGTVRGGVETRANPDRGALSRQTAGRTMALAAVLALVASAGHASADVTYRTIALPGTTGPLGPGLGSATFTAAGLAPVAGITGFARTSVLNQSGDVAFVAASSQGAGVWRNIGGTNQVIARATTASPAPSLTNFGVNAYLGLTMSNANQVGFSYTFTPGGQLGVNDVGQFRSTSAGALEFVARSNAAGALPNGQTNLSGATSTPLQTQGGIMSFVGTWAGGQQAHFVGTPGSFTVALQSGQAVAAAGNAVISGFDGNPALNDSGALAASVNFSTGSGVPAVTGSNARRLVTTRGGTVDVLAFSGAPVSDLPGVNFASTGTFSPAMNNAGQVAFTSATSGVGITANINESTIFRSDASGSVVTALRERTGVPGRSDLFFGGANTSLSTFGAVSINKFGTILAQSSGNTNAAGTALPNGAGHQTLFTIDTSGLISVLAVTGDAAPGTGGTFAAFNASQRAINARGQVAFMATLNVAGAVTTSNDLGLFCSDATGALHLVAREGSLFQVAPGDWRTVQDIVFSRASVGNQPTGGEDGRGLVLNDRGDVVFNLTFTDGTSGVFVANVPGPGAVALFGLAGGLAARRRRA